MDDAKEAIVNHWKRNFRKTSKRKRKKKKYLESSSEDESSDEDEIANDKNDELALTLTESKEVKKDSKNERGIVVCGHCNRVGHGMSSCWQLIGRPAHMKNSYQKGRYRGNGNPGTKNCWECGSPDHLAYNCPLKRTPSQLRRRLGKI